MLLKNHTLSQTDIFKDIMETCNTHYCDKKSQCRGYCGRHYNQVRRYGKTFKTGFDRRPAIIDGDVAKLPLGVDAKDGYAILDKENTHLDKYRWCISSTGYAKTRIDGRTVSLHKVIMSYPDHYVDHINQNKLDNRIENLRLCNVAQNAGNSKLSKLNKSGHKGVYPTKGGKWLVTFAKKHVGIFEDINEAARAYNKLALKRWGDFANLNVTKKEG